MKIRSGFVSNSSSSSFIVWGSNDVYIIPSMVRKGYRLINPKTLNVPQTFGGETGFGRQRENYTDIGSRINWAYMSVRSKRNAEDLALLEEVLFDAFKIDVVKWNLRGWDDPPGEDIIDGHIDAGGMYPERFEEAYEQIFGNGKDSIFRWIFGVGNYIANRCDEYDDMDELEVDHRCDYSWNWDFVEEDN